MLAGKLLDRIEAFKRDGAPLLLSTRFGLFPWLQKIFADASHAASIMLLIGRVGQMA